MRGWRGPLPATLLAVASVLAVTPLVAQSGPSDSGASRPRPIGSAVALDGRIDVDGRLDEPAWGAAPPITGLTQVRPDEGAAATQRTEVRILFDTDALYIGARMYDTLGADGVRTALYRRDQYPDGSDWLELTFDTFHDHLGQTLFATNPSGMKADAYGPGGANLDYAWDPVWDVATRIDAEGWTAEMRIPLAQLRYPRDPVQTWGLQVRRLTTRTNELVMWAFWRLNEMGGPAFYGDLEGLHISRAPGRGEVLPYVVGRSTNDPGVAAGDPFSDPHQVDGRVGADFKYLLTSDLTLSGTVNPDFGQVEVDPAVVNLSAFETYYPERRPFFVEGRGLYDFGWLNCYFCSNVSSVNLFYPRRIGRAPQAAGNAYAQGVWADVPENTRILAAAKVTGRAQGRWSVGVLDAVTAREQARVETAEGQRVDVEVEPFTNYFVGRVSRDVPSRNGFVRGMATSVVRDLGDPVLATQLNRHAEALGLETNLWWGRRTYRLMAHAAVAQVAGDSLAILRAQTSSARYFQRPDRDHGSNGLFTDRYDPSLTAMRGYAGFARMSKDGGNWMWEVSGMVKSPGFEANDVAFNTEADRLWMSANLGRRFTQPNRVAREMAFLGGAQQAFNYDGDLVDRQWRVFAEATFLNYWDAAAFAIYQPPRLDDRLSRGGPVLGRAATRTVFLRASTDRRKPVSVSTEPFFGCRDGVCWWNANLYLTVRPVPNIAVSLGPTYVHDDTRDQYVTSVDDPTATAMYGRRHVFALLEQHTFVMDTRVSVAFTPALTLDLYLQPLIASAAYAEFKEYDRPRTIERSVYGVDRGTIALAGGVYTVDPDGPGPAAPFTFPAPDFNYRSLRGNAVLRWEFRPGSTLYAVWTQSRTDVAPVGDFDLQRDWRALRHTPPTNVFLVKMSWWLGF